MKYRSRRKPKRVPASQLPYLVRGMAQDVRKLKRIMNVEFKRFETANSGSTANPTALTTATLISGIPQGDTAITRDGDSVKAQSLHVRVKGEINGATPEDCLMRLIVVKANYGERTVPLLEDILEGPTNILSFRDVDKSRGYKVLCDKTKVVTASGYNSIVTWDENFQLNHHLKFEGTAGTDHTFGSLWYFLVDDAGTNHPAFQVYTRIRYTDN